MSVAGWEYRVRWERGDGKWRQKLYTRKADAQRKWNRLRSGEKETYWNRRLKKMMPKHPVVGLEIQRRQVGDWEGQGPAKAQDRIGECGHVLPEGARSDAKWCSSACRQRAFQTLKRRKSAKS